MIIRKRLTEAPAGGDPAPDGEGMTYREAAGDASPVRVVNGDGASSVLLVCEHASCHIPPALERLGLPEDDALSHAAWDPGALGVAEEMARVLDAPLVAGTVSRLVYDCNRPPGAADAMPARSEVIEVPGNRGLDDAARAARTRLFYEPFRNTVAARLAAMRDPVLVTVHSFTPVFHGRPRAVEIGVLHDKDTRLADAMLDMPPRGVAKRIERNAPYGPEDGVTHTLREHGIANGHPNVMLEIRSDLVAAPDRQRAMGRAMAEWVAGAFRQLALPGTVRCTA